MPSESDVCSTMILLQKVKGAVSSSTFWPILPGHKRVEFMQTLPKNYRVKNFPGDIFFYRLASMFYLGDSLLYLFSIYEQYMNLGICMMNGKKLKA